MSTKSGSGRATTTTTTRRGEVVLAGYLKKLKTSKRKYFVLRAAETCESSAHLEYYDSEKKFRNGMQAKRSIPIKACFNINKRHDLKNNKHVIALYTKDDCFCVILDNETESDVWLKALLAQQQGEEVPDGVMPRPTFEHIWQVQLLNRGISTMVPGYKTSPDTTLTHRLCLTDKTLSLIKQEEAGISQTDFPLSLIRSCGSLKNYFYLEAGRSSVIGAGEIWMEAEDSHIAANIYHTVYNTMNSSREELAPQSRNRSSSANEASKPNNIPRRQTMGAGTPKPIPSHQHQAGSIAWPRIVNHQRTRSLPLAHPTSIITDHLIHPPKSAKRPTQSSKCFTDPRIRCDSMPSRPRTSSEGNHPLTVIERPWLNTQVARDISHSPPLDSPVSPPSVTCSTDSAGSSLSIDDSEAWHDDTHRRFPISLTPDEAIAEENCDDCADSPCLLHASPTSGCYMPMNTTNVINVGSMIGSDDGYVDMSPRARHLNMSPAPSLSSVTSGTPSTNDIAIFYKLDKVCSFIPSEEDETCSNERQRTYSMGSKPFKTRSDQPRNRACSVGSKTKKGYRVLPPHGYNYYGTKSSSAPILSSRVNSSHSSIDPMDDLMEMDFSRKPSNDYIPMTPAANRTAHSTDTPQSQHQRKNDCNSGYVDMKPGAAPVILDNSESAAPYVEMKLGTSPNKPSSRSDYIEMDGKSNKMKVSKSPIADYIDMNFHTQNATAAPQATGVCHMLEYPYTDWEGFNAKKETEGYVKMSLGAAGKTSSVGDYTNMSFGGAASSENNSRSKPINIQQPATGYDKFKMMILPLQNSLPKSRSRKNSRRDSKDSSSSSVTTPSSSSTIFPLSLNSPSSPVCSKSPERSKSVMVEAAAATAAASTSPASSSRIKVPPTVLSAKYQASGFGRDYSDYALMNVEPNNRLKKCYAWRPTATTNASTAGVPTATVLMSKLALELNSSGYALMSPGDTFKPIDEESNSSGSGKPSRPGSESSEISTLVSSPTTTMCSSCEHDASTNVPQLHYASLDLTFSENGGKSDVDGSALSKNGADAGDLAYAEIDFMSSNMLKVSKSGMNA